MDPEDPDPAGAAPEYVPTSIDSRAGETSAPAALDPDLTAALAANADVDLEFIETGWIRREPEPAPRPVEERLGLALLRLRVYRGLSQAQLERISKVDQSIISRVENGKLGGLAIRRLYDLLRALRADEITFGPGPKTVPQSSWEDAMYGDLWERAGRVAEARLSRRRSA
jgi:transcriptional regulator with XRE-family HTH domain